MIDNKAFYSISSGLYLLSSTYNEHSSACLINTFLQVASHPKRVMISLNKDNYTHELVDQSHVFHVSVLSCQVNMDFIRNFGFQSGKDSDKFAGYSTDLDSLGNKYIKDYVVSDFVLKVVDTLDLGSHDLYLAEVMEAKISADDEVLTYEYYQKVLKGTTPPKAASYTTDKKIGYRCPICGYIEEVEILPEGFVCPICQAPGTIFEKIG